MSRYEPKVMYPMDLDSTVAAQNPPDYPLRFLAEGDSWFSFGSWKLSSYLNMLRFKVPTAIVTLAEPGALIVRMSTIAQNAELDHWLDANWGAFKWNAVLISGGGNDLIDAAGTIITPSALTQPVKPADQYVSKVELDKVLAAITASYQRIVALRDRPSSPCVGVPLITHDYDLSTPRNAPARFLVPMLGPWLYPAMVAAKIPASEWNAVSDHLLGELGQCLISLESTLPNFHVARTQGTLRRAALDTTGVSNDWDNEIHPRPEGYRKVGVVLTDLIESLTL